MNQLLLNSSDFSLNSQVNNGFYYFLYYVQDLNGGLFALPQDSYVCMDVWMYYGWMDGWMDGRMDGWMIIIHIYI